MYLAAAWHGGLPAVVACLNQHRDAPSLVRSPTMFSPQRPESHRCEWRDNGLVARMKIKVTLKVTYISRAGDVEDDQNNV